MFNYKLIFTFYPGEIIIIIIFHYKFIVKSELPDLFITDRNFCFFEIFFILVSIINVSPIRFKYMTIYEYMRFYVQNFRSIHNAAGHGLVFELLTHWNGDHIILKLEITPF
jgi:hypothetical protein